MNYYAVKSSYEKAPRFSTLLALVLFCIAVASLPASSDQLTPIWQQAREKWNAIGDKARQGDQNALFALFKEVEDCQRQMACVSLLANIDATKDQIEAASAATNLGWMHRQGFGVQKDLRKAYEYYHFAADKDNPVALHNMGEFAESGEVPGTIKVPETAIYFYEKAAALGLAGSAIRLGSIHFSQGKKELALQRYNQALQLIPSESQRKSIQATLDKFGYQIADNKIVPKNKTVTPPTPKSASKPASTSQPSTPATPSLRQDIISQGKWCKGDSATGEANRSVLRTTKRDLDKWKKDLKKWSNSLNVYYNTEVARSPDNYRYYKEDFARFENEQRDYNAAASEYNDANTKEKTNNETHKQKCSLSITQTEHQQLCQNDASNPWCKRYNFDN